MVVHQAEESVMPAKSRVRNKKTDSVMPRTSVSFPPEVYKTLADLATRKKVSIGWVVRDAVEKYVADQWPLFSNLKGN
jgi:predicted DNA-binding protein